MQRSKITNFIFQFIGPLLVFVARSEGDTGEEGESSAKGKKGAKAGKGDPEGASRGGKHKFPCRFGAQCYLTSKFHLNKYSHKESEEEKEEEVISEVGLNK